MSGLTPRFATELTARRLRPNRSVKAACQ